LVEQLAVPSAG